MSADIFLSRPDAAEVAHMARETWRREDVNLSFIRGFARDRWGVDAFVLHDSGLLLGRKHVTILLEACADPEQRIDGQTTEAPVPSDALPWQRVGWYTRTLRWLRERLELRGEGLLVDVSQVSTYDLGCVLRANTSSGVMYLKAAETPFEALVTRHLAQSRPGSVPEVLAVDEERCLLLTRDAGTHLAESGDLAAWERAVTELALLHFHSKADAFEGLGAPSYEFGRLPSRIRELLLDSDALGNWGLREETIAGLEAIVPRLEVAHARISELGLPLCLTHGDAHPMNALLGPKGVVLFDWNEAGHAHRFTDVGWFLAWLSHPARASLPVRRAHSAAVEHLWITYLDALGVRGAGELLEDVMVLALAHRAVVFHERFRHWEGTVPGWRPGYASYYLRWLRKHWSCI